jgi:uncharacterized membrane protein YphA (DoxX/SURF4 family)
MKPQKRGVDWRNFFGASNRVIPQPVGIVGHIVPWNFPIFLCFGGLTSAFAAVLVAVFLATGIVFDLLDDLVLDISNAVDMIIYNVTCLNHKRNRALIIIKQKGYGSTE